MTFLRITSLATLISLSGAIVQVYGQEKREEKQPEKQQAQPKPPAQPKQQAQPKEQAQPKQRQPQQQRAEQPAPARQKPEAARPATAAKPQPRQQPETARPATAAKPQPRQQPETARPATAAKPEQQQRPQKQSARQQQPAQAANRTSRQSYSPPERSNQQAKTWQQQASWHPQGSWQAHSTWQQDRSSNWQSDHRTWSQRGGYGGYYIPEASFSLHFGDEHWFRIQSEPVIVDGYPRFQYGGYSFMMVDPWPSDWAPNWYAANDVYVGYDNGYYLYNRAYPGEAIAITVVL